MVHAADKVYNAAAQAAMSRKRVVLMGRRMRSGSSFLLGRRFVVKNSS
jgi:hypothetical protein